MAVGAGVLLWHQRALLFMHLDWHLFMHNGSAATHSLMHAREHWSSAVMGFFGSDFCACATDAMQSIARTTINLVMPAPAAQCAILPTLLTRAQPLFGKLRAGMDGE